MRGKYRAQPGVILQQRFTLLFGQWWQQYHPYPQETMNVSRQLWEHLATFPMQRQLPSRKNRDLFLLAWTRNNANESAVALHYFFKERTKAVSQSHFWWIGRNTHASSWISVTGSFNIPSSAQQYEYFFSFCTSWKYTHTHTHSISLVLVN